MNRSGPTTKPWTSSCGSRATADDRHLGTPFIDLGNVELLPAIAGLVLGWWTLLGVIKATVIRYMPPAMVAFPVAAIGIRNGLLHGELLIGQED